MLRDEAIETLLSRLEKEPNGRLVIDSDNGEFQAYYIAISGNREFEGEWKPVLSDALSSLVEELA